MSLEVWWDNLWSLLLWALTIFMVTALRLMCGGALRACSHGFPSHLRSIRAISIIESMKVGTYHFTQVSKSQVPTMTWMTTWQHSLEVRLRTCIETWVEQKPISQFKSQEFFWGGALGSCMKWPLVTPPNITNGVR